MVVKPFFLLLSLFLTLKAAENKSELYLHILNGGVVSTKIIVSALNTMGERVNLSRYKNDVQSIEMEMTLSGRKAFDPKYFRELLGESGVVLTKGSVKNKSWSFEIDATTAVWNIPSITLDEGAQLEKSTLPFWYKVESIKEISVEPPYSGHWCPDIAAMDANMNVLGLLRIFTARDQMKFSLPEGSTYLKVSSTNGMKLLKEGMWIEGINGR
ncbi:MAG: hypothetical protein NTY39_00840 [Campylobacterales bacterium]|nr:hypothetical protein [Campylobacterales bacterium]